MPVDDSTFPWRDQQERFRGRTEGRLDEHDRRLDGFEDHFRTLQTSVDKLAISLARLGVKVALAAALSAMFASGVVSVIVLWVGHHL